MNNVWFYLTTIMAVLGIGFVSGDTLNLLRNTCPYSDLCTMDSRRPYTRSNDTVPCCYDCLCDEYCSLFDDCCPDVDQNKTKFAGLKLKCREARTSSTFADSRSAANSLSATDKIPSYRFVDFCPVEYQGSSKIVEKCEREVDGSSEFEDLVLVSDKQQRIFKNKHCAICHGVLQVRSWNLNILECSKDFREMQLALSASTSFILENCLLVSQRPRGVPVTARTLECENIDTCDGQADDVKDGCLNGPYMPYVEVQATGMSRIKIHKNVFCFQCHGESVWSSLCPVSIEMAQKGAGSTYNILLNHKMERPHAPAPTKSECREHELMDPYKGKCRQLFCPPFEMVSYGKCVPLSDHVSKLLVHTTYIYTLKNESVYIPQSYNYNQSILQHHLDTINSKYGYSNCTISNIVTSVRLDKFTGKLSLLVLKITYETSQICSLGYIGEQIRQAKTNNRKELWFLNDRFYEMDEQITFNNIEMSVTDPKYDYLTLIFHATNPILNNQIRAFFVCPYFILNYKEYSNYLENFVEGEKGNNVSELKPWSQYIDGFYPIGQDQVAACVQAYLPKNGCTGYTFGTITLGLLIHIVLNVIKF